MIDPVLDLQIPRPVDGENDDVDYDDGWVGGGADAYLGEHVAVAVVENGVL